MTEFSTFRSEFKWDEPHYKALFDQCKEAVFLASPDGKIEQVNAAACAMFGWTMAEFCHGGRSLILDSADPRLQVAIQQRKETGAFFGELTGLKRDGSKFPLEISSSIYAGMNGSNYTCTIMRDISRQKQLEASLVFQSQIVDHIAEGVNLVRVSDGTIVYANPSFYQMFGYQPGELLGENVSILNASGEKSPGEVAREIQGILSEKGSWSGEVRNVRKCGELFWCNASISMIDHYQYGKVWISLHLDITKSKEAEIAMKETEAMLRDLNKTKDKFFSIIAHDLKSPFNAIIGFSDLLKEQVKQNDYEGIEEFAGIIQNSATRAMELLENLLEWSRLQTGRMRFNPEYIDLAAQIQETANLLRDAAQQKGIGIAMDVPEHLYLMVDPLMLSSILRNLLTNAIKFTKVCGRIVIEARQLHSEVLVVVKDNGVGISKEMIRKLFRLDETFSTVGTNKEKGTGLGLKIVKEFIEKHGGHLSVESTPGEGSTFSFTLPN
jgi:PAS domain S-box-containing protein